MSDKIDQQSAEFNNSYSNEDEIDLRELMSVVWTGKWIILCLTLLFGAGSVIYAINQPNIYKSEALLAPVEQERTFGLGGLQSQLGGLASLAGVNLGGGSSSKTLLAIEILKSRDFTTSFIQKHNILADLMAPESWNVANNTLSYQQDIYNISENRWTRNISLPLVSKPSMQEAYMAFSEIMTVNTDSDTGMITLTVEHISPFIAQHWVNWLVEDINQTMKTRDIVEAKESTLFLTAQLEQTKISDIREVLYNLIEDQTKIIMFANVREEYVFKTIDKALVPEAKSGPKRALICVLGTILGGILGGVIVFVRYFNRGDI
jgi:uncharacterized protein involved in exopolysaccharide biosynthesis